MSGHSKWSQIKHKKAISDAKKGKIFSKISRQITVAVRGKGPDPENNSTLRMAITMAQEANMPKENIERAIEKASGKATTDVLEEIILEAYGPGGVALIIKAITDNRNRTLAEIRHILNLYHGKLAGEGSVRWLFENVGRIIIEKNPLTEEELELEAIELGAQDIRKEKIEGQEKTIIFSKPEDLESIKKKLQEKGVMINQTSFDLIPKDKLAQPDQATLFGLQKLFDALDDQSDVQEIYSNL